MSPVQSAGAARRWAIGLLVCVAAAGGCNSNATLVQPPSFNRPGQMVLTCYDTVAKHVVPADRCDGVEGKSSETVVLTAVVTQTARGELGAVDLRDDVPLDSDPVVPGFTFRRVGESPTGLAIDPAHPEVVFVASFGARGVQALSTSELIPGSKGVSLPSAFVPLSDAPTDLVLSPDGSTLYAGLADTPALAAIPVEREQTGDTLTAVRFGTPRIIPLGEDGAASGSASSTSGAASVPAVAPPAPPTREPASRSAFPEPKRVKTVSVRADGSIIGGETVPPAAAAKAPERTTPAPARNATPKSAARADATTTASPKPASPKPVAKPKPAPRQQVAAVKPQEDAVAPASAAADEEAPKPAVSGSYAVQVASAGSEAEARQAASRLAAKLSSALGGRHPAVIKASAKLYRVRVTGLSKESANAMCGRVKAAGGACFVAR